MPDGTGLAVMASTAVTLDRRRARKFVLHHGWAEFILALEAELSTTLVKDKCDLDGLSSYAWLTSHDETTFVAEGSPKDFLIQLADIGRVLRKQSRPKGNGPPPRFREGTQLVLLDDGMVKK